MNETMKMTERGKF